jgi:TonB family protein
MHYSPTMRFISFLLPSLLLLGCLTEEQQAELAAADTSVVEEQEVDTFIVGGHATIAELENPEGESLRLENDTAIENIRQMILQGDTPSEIAHIDATVVKNPDIGPSFPGGSTAMDKYILQHLVYPFVAFQNEIAGTVQVRFIVEPDGSLSSVTVLKGIGYGCDESAIDLIKGMPRWTPGKKGGANVRCQVVLPVYFGKKNQY